VSDLKMYDKNNEFYLIHSPDEKSCQGNAKPVL
jgi:hypothetical protein